MRLSPVLSRGSSAAACRWALPAQSGGRYLAATAPSSTTVSAHKHQLQGPTSSSRKSFRSVPARCSGGSAVDAAGDSDGPGERGQPPPAPAKAANAVGGSSGAAKQPTDARPLNGIQQHQTQDVQTLPLREALVAPFFNEQVDIRAGNVDIGAGQLDFRAGQMELRAGQLDIRAGQVDIRAGQLDIRAGQLEFRAGQVDFRAEQLDFRAGQLDFRAGQLELRAGQVDFRAEQLDIRAGQLDFRAGQVNCGTGQLDIRSAPDQHEVGQQELIHPVQASVKQQEEQHQEQQDQQLEHPQQHVSALTAHSDTEDMETSVPGQSALEASSEQILKRAPRLMDCVCMCEPDNSSCPSGSCKKVDGVVLGSADGGARLKVWTLPNPQHCDHLDMSRTIVCAAADCEPLASTMPGQYRYLPYDPEHKGVPVTRWTATPGMLVRRGYDVIAGEEDAAAAGEVGVLQPSPDMGDTCLVEWASGSQGVYDTGRGKVTYVRGVKVEEVYGRFELVHLEVSPTSGAPVVGSDWADANTHNPGELLWGGRELQKPAHVCAHGALSNDTEYDGASVHVEHGTHWVYGGTDPDVGMIADAADEQQEGMVMADWTNGTTVRHHASPANGYDLCYSARPGDPVTLFTARQGQRVHIAGVDKSKGSGVLLRPQAVLSGYGVVWSVNFPNVLVGNLKYYFVGSSDCRPTQVSISSRDPWAAELLYS